MRLILEHISPYLSPIIVELAALFGWPRLGYGIGRAKLYELPKSCALKASKLGAKTPVDVESADWFLSTLPDFRATRLSNL